ncbi:hypothetical protein ES703_61008 [subsurface metagenome]
MTLSANNVKSAELNYFIVFFLPLCFILPVRASSQYNVNASPSHIGGNGYCPRLPRLGDDVSLFFMLLGIKHLMWNSFPLQ